MYPGVRWCLLLILVYAIELLEATTVPTRKEGLDIKPYLKKLCSLSILMLAFRRIIYISFDPNIIIIMKRNRSISILSGCSKLALLLIGLFFVHCTTQDIDTLPPYQADNDFDEVDDLPDLEDPDPDGVDVEIGDIDNSKIIDAILEAIRNAEGEEELAGLLSKLFERMGTNPDASGPLDPEIQAFLSGLNAELAAKIIKGEVEVSDKLKDFAAKSGSGSSFSELLPQAIFPKLNGETLRTVADLDGIKAARRSKAQSSENVVDSATLRVNHWGETCEEAAQNAFEIRVGELDLQKEDQLNTVELNYQRRLSEIEVAYEFRLTQQQQIYDFQIDYLILNVSSVLQAISVINNPQLKNSLLLFAAVYTIQAAQLVQNWNNVSLAAIDEAKEKELEIIEDHRDAMISNVETAYNKAVAFAEEVLEKALEKCHNQGAGN